ncbi:YraN family protein [Microbacterium sp. C5A9]|uniref:YraN family protein n=1 Tax=Microbacterium sp. C5A9 TaxID=2736663 RepID=UPI001F5288ED|nr:YraN family protein [Microbacterium sp. C5A9]MCI1017958.1 YraN family protein [Microbacterium sp. C5A9]
MAAKDELGRAGEQRAVLHLNAIGYRILDRNWRSAQGELDIVARIDRRLAVVEVKTRRTTAFGHPFEALDNRKLRRLWQLAHAWAAAHPEQARGLDIAIEAIGIVGDDPSTGELEHLTDLP